MRNANPILARQLGTLAVIMALVCPALTMAQTLKLPAVSYPGLPAHAARMAQFVPRGWKLEKQSRGDLNGDSRADAALLLREQDSANFIHHSGFGENPLNSNPRILLVVLAEKDGGYRRVLANHSFIARRDDPTLGDPFNGVAAGGMQISHGTLQIKLGRFYSAGSWSMDNPTFTFRWRDGQLKLIGYDDTTIQRNTGTIEGISINYLTRRVKQSHGNIANDKTTVTWIRLPPGPPLTIGQVGDGLAFNPESKP